MLLVSIYKFYRMIDALSKTNQENLFLSLIKGPLFVWPCGNPSGLFACSYCHPFVVFSGLCVAL